MKVVALDPGTSTGVCVYYDKLKPEHRIRTLTMGPDPHHLRLLNFLHETEPEVLVYEKFQYRQRRTTGPADYVVLDSVQYIGIAELYIQQSPVTELESQTPSQAKGLWDNKKIKKVGLWKPTRPHEMDALRHMLYYLTVKRRVMDWAHQLKPKNPTEFYTP